MKTLSERLLATREGKKAWLQERVITQVTERLCRLLEEQGITRTEFAKRLGASKGYVTQLLDGEANMQLRTLSDAFLALDRAVEISDSPITAEYVKPALLRIFKVPEWAEEIDAPVEIQLAAKQQ